MNDPRAKQKQSGVYIDASEIDITNASLDSSLSKVWSDEVTGELSVSMERILFDSLLDIAARYLEPHGFALNLENLLSTVDSMRLSVFADISSKKASDGRAIAKKLMPGLYLHLPRKKSVGPLLQRFYDEVGRYESELARLQEIESKSKKIMNAAIRDDSGRQAVEILRIENAALRDELVHMSKRLSMAEAAMRAVPVPSGDNQMPNGVRSCIIRSIRLSEGTILVKSGDQQFTVALKTMGGLPQLNARALSFHEGGVLKSLWVFDPPLENFTLKFATVLAIDGRKAKLRFDDRYEVIASISEGQSIPALGARMLAKFAGGYLIDVMEIGSFADNLSADKVYDIQTKRQIEEEFGGVVDD